MTAVIPDLVNERSEVESVGNPCLDLSELHQKWGFAASSPSPTEASARTVLLSFREKDLTLGGLRSLYLPPCGGEWIFTVLAEQREARQRR